MHTKVCQKTWLRNCSYATVKPWTLPKHPSTTEQAHTVEYPQQQPIARHNNASQTSWWAKEDRPKKKSIWFHYKCIKTDKSHLWCCRSQEFLPGRGTGSDHEGTGQMSQMLIIFYLLTCLYGCVYLWKCMRGTLIIGTLCSTYVLLWWNVLPTNPGPLKTGNLFCNSLSTHYEPWPRALTRMNSPHSAFTFIKSWLVSRLHLDYTAPHPGLSVWSLNSALQQRQPRYVRNGRGLTTRQIRDECLCSLPTETWLRSQCPWMWACEDCSGSFVDQALSFAE